MSTGFLAALAAICRRQPTAIALDDAQGAVTYAALWQRLCQAAGGLQAHGVRAGDAVGLSYAPSTDYVVALLACWQAGAFWLPLTGLPPARREALLQRVRPVCTLGPEQLRLEQLSAEVFQTAPYPAAAMDPAYLIFTSGSTGEPKGVLVPHAGLVPMLQAQIALFGLTPADRCLWLLSPLFDASVSDIGTALLSGATLVIDARPLADFGHFYRLLARQRITLVDLPPALLASLSPERMPESLKTLVIGGEVAAAEQLARWSPRLRLINVYGPTEATVCTSAQLCTPQTPAGLLGQPLPGIRYAIDGAEPRPGASGELWIHGPGLALGYWQQPQLSAERFVEAGCRWYRSGDLVACTADGGYRFLGRRDRQFKHQGRLICPEEIEAALCALPGIQRAAVLKHASGALCACVEGELAFADGQAGLAASLPDWMLPTVWIRPEPWPLTPSGKADFAALAGWPLDSPPVSPALTPAESNLAAIWTQVLDQPVRSAAADFFALGGGSIQVLACVALAAEAGLPLSPESFYQGRRLDRIAATVAPDPRDDCAGAPGLSADALRQRLPPDLRFSDRRNPAADSGRIGRVLLTGATGFFGSRLLAAGLAHTGHRYRCLVRASSPAAGRQRLAQALRPWGVALDPRVEVLTGDLTRPDLGLAEPESLAEIDAVLHCAAAVDLVRDFDSLYGPNVAGLAHLAGHRALCGKPLHYVSTLSVLVAAGNKPARADEADDLRQTDQVYGGYAQSKWAAEVWLRRQHARGLATVIYRPGLISGDSRSGHGPCRDWFGGLIRGLLALGAVPAGCEAAASLQVDLTPVDYAARALVELMQRPLSAGKTWHLANPRPLSLKVLFAELASWARLDALPVGRWQELALNRLRRRAGLDEAAALLALCRALGTEPPAWAWHGLDLFQATGIRLASPTTVASLEAAGIVCPPPDRHLLRRYFAAAQDHPWG